jgi:hypothetical protein
MWYVRPTLFWEKNGFLLVFTVITDDWRMALVWAGTMVELAFAPEPFDLELFNPNIAYEREMALRLLIYMALFELLFLETILGAMAVNTSAVESIVTRWGSMN